MGVRRVGGRRTRRLRRAHPIVRPRLTRCCICRRMPAPLHPLRAVHEGLGTVVAGPHTDASLIEDLAEVVRVDIAVADGQDPAAVTCVGRTVDDQVVAMAFVECAQRIVGEQALVGPNSVHADCLQVGDGGAQSDDLGDRRRSGLELPWKLVRNEALSGDVQDHLAATQEGRHCVEQFRTTPQHADARGSTHLVAGERHEVAGPCRYIGRKVRYRLAAVDEAQGTGCMRGIGQLAYRCKRAEHVRRCREGEKDVTPSEQLGRGRSGPGGRRR